MLGKRIYSLFPEGEISLEASLKTKPGWAPIVKKLPYISFKSKMTWSPNTAISLITWPWV